MNDVEKPKKPNSDNNRDYTKLNFFLVGITFLSLIGTAMVMYNDLSLIPDEINMWSVVIASLSVMVNIIVLGLVFATKIGQEAFKRFWNRVRYRKGGYVNSLYISKNGNVMEKFLKIDDEGKIKINNKSYVRNPRHLLNYKNIPTYVHIEDTPNPIAPFHKWRDEELSSSELDEVMMNARDFDIKAFFRKIAPFVLIACVVVVGVMAGSLYFNWQIYDVIVQSGASVGEVSSR